MPEVLDMEITQMVENMKSQHGETATSIACLLHLTRTLMRQFGRQTGTDVQPLLDIQQMLVLNWISSRNVDLLDVTAATTAIGQAGETLAYLTSLPL